MSSRVGELLQSLRPREARRIDVVLLRAGAIAAIVAILAVTRLSSAREAMAVMGLNSRLGRYSVQTLLMVQAGFAIGLASRLAGDGVGDRRSGLLELLSLTGCTPGEWLRTRLLSMLPSVLSLAVVFVPFFHLAITLGGIDWDQIVLTEFLLGCAFAMLVGVGLLRGHEATNRAAIRNLWGILVALEAAFGLPIVIAGGLMKVGVAVPGVVEDGLLYLSRCGTRTCIQSVLRGSVSGTQLAVAALVPLGIAAMAIFLWMRRLYADPTEAPVIESAPVASPVPIPLPGVSSVAAGTQRRSRRSWDDALAWQAYEVFQNGARVVGQRSKFYVVATAMLLILTWVAPDGWSDVVLSWFFLLCGGALFRGVTRVGECLQQEIRESTLSTLILTPHEPVELHDGWSRGIWRLMRPELVLFSVGIGVSLIRNSAQLSPAIVAIGIGILSTGPFFTLSPLLPYTFKGIATGLLVFAGMLVCAVAATLAALFGTPWFAPLVLAPLVYSWNRLCRWLVASWLSQRLQSLV